MRRSEKTVLSNENITYLALASITMAVVFIYLNYIIIKLFY